MEYKKLGDIATYINGYAFKPEDRGTEGLPIIRIQDLTGNAYDLGFYDGKHPEKIEINNGDVLISWSASLGVYVWNRGKALLNQHIFKVAFNKVDVDKNYFVYAVRHKLNEMAAKAHGATMKHIIKKDFDAIQIPFPSLQEQAEISLILDKVAHVIEERREELSKLDTLIKARFVELFGDLRTNTKEWKIQAFSELTDLITDGEHATPRRTTNGIYLLSARNILNHAIQLDDVDYIDQEEYDRIAKRVVPQAGDVLISCSGTVGRCCTVPVGLKFQMVRSAALLRFKPEINPKFAEYMITSEYLQEQINRLKTASSQANLFQGKIAKLKGFAPPMELQQEFNAFVAVIDKSKHHSPHLPIPPLKWYPLPKNEVPIMEEKIIAITNEMAEVLNIAQLKKLQEVLVKAFSTEEPERKPTNQEYLRLFLEAKSIEGCSPPDTSILRSDGPAPFCRSESAGSKNDDGTDAGIPVGLSAAPELQQSDHRQHPAEHFQFFLVAGRGRPHSEKPHAPHSQNQNQEDREGGHLRRGHRKAPGQLHHSPRPGHD